MFYINFFIVMNKYPTLKEKCKGKEQGFLFFFEICILFPMVTHCNLCVGMIGHFSF